MKKIILITILALALAIPSSMALAQSPSIGQVAVYVDAQKATFEATINPQGYTTTVWFEYSADPNFYSWFDTEHKALGAGFTNQKINQTISGLAPQSVYYFRVATDNARSTIRGQVISFQIQANENRITENVSSVERVILNPNTNLNTNNSATVLNAGVNYRATNTGNSIWGDTFLPQNFLGWLVLLVIVVLIIRVTKLLAEIK